MSCCCRNRWTADQAECREGLTLSAKRQRKFDRQVPSFKRTEWTANFFHPLSFPSLSLLFVYFPLFFPFRFVLVVSPNVFLTVYLYVFDPNGLPHSANFAFLHTARQYQRRSLHHNLLGSTVFNCFWAHLITVFSITHNSFFRHNVFTRFWPHFGHLCIRPGRLNGS